MGFLPILEAEATRQDYYIGYPSKTRNISNGLCVVKVLNSWVPPTDKTRMWCEGPTHLPRVNWKCGSVKDSKLEESDNYATLTIRKGPSENEYVASIMMLPEIRVATKSNASSM